MGRHSLPDTTPYDIFNYSLYAGYPALQFAVMAEHRSVLAEEGDWEQQLFAEAYAEDARLAIDGIRSRLQTDLQDPELSRRSEPGLADMMLQSFSGRHAYNPASRTQWHPQVTAKRPHQTWMDWLAHDAPPTYVFDCLRLAAEFSLPSHLQLQPKKQPPPGGCFY